MSVDLRPTWNNILVRRDKESDRTKGGIIIPDQAKGKSKRGKVISVGPVLAIKDGHHYPPAVIKAGDTVFFNSYAGTEIEMDGETLLVLPDTEVIAFTR